MLGSAGRSHRINLFESKTATKSVTNNALSGGGGGAYYDSQKEYPEIEVIDQEDGDDDEDCNLES